MISNFEFVNQIARGAFGNVCLYKRKTDQKQVVIKTIPLDPITKDECQVTETEVKVLAIFKHPNIIKYYESFIEDQTMYIVMEYSPGGNLYDYLKSKRGNLMQEEDILWLFGQLVLGIQRIHKEQILHRDLKSHNILLDHTQTIVKIGDFGISKILESKSKAMTVVGTPCYLSPELCQEKPYNQKSDIWALGCILYELLTLERAFEAESLLAVITKIMCPRYAPVSTQYSSLIRNLVSSMLTKDPNARPSIEQVICNPLIFPTLAKIVTNIGRIHPTD